MQRAIKSVMKIFESSITNTEPRTQNLFFSHITQ